ncbi:MAG: diaminopimelate decarboxylase [Sphingomonadales bacterium]|nr:diaminopimelate decarboxylase [Sphingomonadales bacterium]
MSVSKEELIHAAATYGTPLYVYHAESITRQYQKLMDAFSQLNARFFYAAKALTNLSILRHVRSLGCSIDCSSINEVKLAFKAGFSADQILYTSNSVSFEEIREAVSLGVSVTIDSLSNLEKFAKTYAGSYPVGVRIRPNIMAGGNTKISTGHVGSKFGIPVEQVEALQQLVQAYGLQLRTLHIHTGSEISEAAVFVQGVTLLLELAGLFPSVTVLDLGGGFKVPYRPDEKEIDLAAIAKAVEKSFTDFKNKTDRQLEVWFEPGKYLVAQAGYLLATVTVLKPTDTICFVGVDTGLNHLIRPMFYEAYHSISNLTNAEGAPTTYQITGNICETDDFAQARTLPEVREGDLLAFHTAGAYGFEMSSSYNARVRPAEVLFKDGQPQLIRRRESLDDLLIQQIN